MGGMLIAIGIACAAYGTLILATRTGSRFYRVWLGIGATALVLGAACLPHTRDVLTATLGPSVADGTLLAATILGYLLIAVLLAFAVMSIRIMAAAHDAAPAGLDYLIVLGAQVYPNGQPSRVLEYRLQAALTYLQVNPGTRAIVSGGQGPNEPCPEADAMAAWLTAHSIDRTRIILERRSTTTAENLAFSRATMQAAQNARAHETPAQSHRASDGPDVRVDGGTPRIGIVTNRFHVYRALRIACRQGIRPAWAIPARSTAWRLPHNLLRECLGIIKNTLAGRM